MLARFGRRPARLALLAVSVVAALLSPPTLSLAAHPVSAAAAPTRVRRAALLLHGRTGDLTHGGHLSLQQGHGSASLDAFAVGWPTLRRNVIDANALAGWTTDVFFHTWDAPLAEAVARATGAVAWSAGGAEVNGHAVGGGTQASAEIALLLAREYGAARHVGGLHVGGPRAGFAASSCAPGDAGFAAASCGGVWNSSAYAGAPGGYDRVVAVRFDAFLHVPFVLDKLEDGTLYASNWCKAAGAEVQPPLPPPLLSCRYLVAFSIDAHNTGLPDFYFAGSEDVMWRFYAFFHADIAAGRVKGPDPRIPYNHGLFRERATQATRAGVRFRRYLFHDIDIDLVRYSWCNARKFDAAAAGAYAHLSLSSASVTPWWEGGETDVTTDSEHSLCDGGRYYCSISPDEARTCGAVGSAE